MGGVATLLVAVAAIVVAPLVGYITASRRLSGKIGTSDADALWSESKAIREDYRDQLQEANRRVLKLEGRVANLEGQNNDLVRENLTLQRRIDVLERENEHLKQRVQELLEQLKQERGT